MSIDFPDQDKKTLRTAAYGAVSLIAAATGSPQQVTPSAVVALTSATGPIGYVLTAKTKDIDLTGKTVAELADRVLPALTAAVELLGERSPTVVDDFRRTVLLAVETAQGVKPGVTAAETARKITAALDAGSTGDIEAVPAVVDRPELQKTIEEIIDPGIIGLSVRVNDERGAWVGSAGAAELGGSAKPPVDGHIRIGSNTKTFTATMVLQLVAEGRIGLDVPVVDYLPEFGIDGRITVRMLLQQTSGLFNFTGEIYEDGSIVLGVPMPYGPKGNEWLGNRFAAYRPQELVEIALSKPARFEPGTGWSYSNTNYVLARLLIEKVTGRTVNEEMQRLILGPLGMSHTVVPNDAEIAEPHARAYYRHVEDGEQKTVDVTRQNPSWVSAGGDMISTTQDLHIFISALAGGRLLPAELRAEMFTPVATGIPNMDYGLGVFVLTTSDGDTVISHNGASVGHAALMYSTPDGSKTLTGALNCVDDANLTVAAAFQGAQLRLLNEVFCGGQEA
ncbi:serine hydrolase domain-containing protein [Micromonospora sp. WMMD812]|uniref:serine hydrolase domain-containing protein n=1 Tax=Micromonospora sp. WMMD812 TaxID=3015152 RepID=UPI00248B607E|nr:serine hydrolase domain-containing protein [Micromonospora sp. WMMD812]WBB70119.1 serine hydrolase [Micromonospora sp. WMMD812]